jgi:CMP-N,N'-diacetyllegionaminic acid synthase
MKVLAVVPARGGSKGIPLKNLVLIAGKPLLEWTLAAARGCPLIGRTVVSTDHAGIADYAEKVGVSVVSRPPELAQDATPTAPVLQHAWNWARSQGYDADVVMTLQPTSPLRESHHLSQALELFARYPEADSLVSVQQVPHQFGPEALIQVDGVWGVPIATDPILRRQDKPQYWARNGAAVYLTRSQHVAHFVWGGRTLVFPMDKVASLDIDDKEDLTIAEAVLLARHRSV